MKSELIDLTKQKKIVKKNNFYYLPKSPKSPNLPRLRLNRRKASLPKLRLAARAANLIGLLPWVKLVCVTGSLAMENSDPDDDIDLMIVTSQNRLWLTRPLVVLLISLFFKRRKPTRKFSAKGRSASGGNNLTMKQFSNSLCLNLWLDSSVLAMPPHRRNLRTAHELAQMKPLVNKNRAYEKMLWQNRWAKKFLANFWSTIQQFNNLAINNKTNNLLNLLNYFLFRLQLWYMSRRRTSEEVTLHSAFFHPSEHSENSENR